ncbi:MAG: hypothetical protein ABSF83_00910 [Nitrososphaerales archaeon]|jgi:hypothetical protein
MSSCEDEAHCSVHSAAASLGGNLATFGHISAVDSMGVPEHGTGPGDRPPPSPRPAYVRTITLRDWGPEKGRPIESVETERVGRVPAAEGLGERILRIVKPVREPLGPGDFIQRASEFLGSIGTVHVASLEVDGTPVFVLQDEGSGGFPAVVQKANEFLDSHPGSVRQMDLKVFGRSAFFFLEMVLTYRPVHSPHEPALSVTVGAKPVALHVVENETLQQYSDRLERLRSDPQARANIEKQVEEKGSELVGDLSYHIASAFPGARFSVIEQDESDENA